MSVMNWAICMLLCRCVSLHGMEQEKIYYDAARNDGGTLFVYIPTKRSNAQKGIQGQQGISVTIDELKQLVQKLLQTQTEEMRVSVSTYNGPPRDLYFQNKNELDAFSNWATKLVNAATISQNVPIWLLSLAALKKRSQHSLLQQLSSIDTETRKRLEMVIGLGTLSLFFACVAPSLTKKFIDRMEEYCNMNNLIVLIELMHVSSKKMA